MLNIGTRPTFDGRNRSIELHLFEADSIKAKRRVVRSVLDRLENELLQQYFARGKYNVQIRTITTELERNRVDLEIQIAEGKAAKIRNINKLAHNYRRFFFFHA